MSKNLNPPAVEPILSVLSCGPLTGADIILALRQTGQNLFTEREGEIYPVLQDMLRRKLVSCRTKEPVPGLPRKYYRLTPAGAAKARKLPHPLPAPEPPSDLPALDDISLRIIRMRRWCSDATLGISVSPDREIAAQELYDHLGERFTRLIRSGADPDEAEAQAVRAMGSPREIAAQFARVHNPFWTKALSFTRRIILVLAVLTVFFYGFHFLDTQFFSNSIVKFDADGEPGLAGTHTLLWSGKSDAADQSDGYSIRVKKVSLWETVTLDGETRQLLNIQLSVFNPIPWSEKPDFSRWIWARDSLGNYYVSPAEDTPALEPSLQITQYHTAPTTYIQDIWIFQYVSQDAQWIELHYDRSGRDILLHIDLTGGDPQ